MELFQSATLLHNIYDMRIYDAHTHLNGDELYPQREDYLSQFIQAG